MGTPVGTSVPTETVAGVSTTAGAGRRGGPVRTDPCGSSTSSLPQQTTQEPTSGDLQRVSRDSNLRPPMRPAELPLSVLSSDLRPLLLGPIMASWLLLRKSRASSGVAGSRISGSLPRSRAVRRPSTRRCSVGEWTPIGAGGDSCPTALLHAHGEGARPAVMLPKIGSVPRALEGPTHRLQLTWRP